MYAPLQSRDESIVAINPGERESWVGWGWEVGGPVMDKKREISFRLLAKNTRQQNAWKAIGFGRSECKAGYETFPAAAGRSSWL